MLVIPCASVSWISRAIRSRSAITPAEWCATASSSRVASSSSISSARCSLWVITLSIQMPSNMLTTRLITIHGKMSQNASVVQPAAQSWAIPTQTSSSTLKNSASIRRSLSSQICGATMNRMKTDCG